MNATAIAAVAARAGVRPRPVPRYRRTLNLPGAVPNAQWTAPRQVDDRASARETGTVVLEPTPAQLAAGVRVIEIEPGDAYASIATLHELAVARGWRAIIAQSRYLTEPSNAGEHSRRGRRLEKVMQTLRLVREPVHAWGAWEYDVERAKWTANGGQYGFLVPGKGIVGVTPCNVTALKDLIERMGAAK